MGLQNGPDGENSLVDTLMLCDAKMWKGTIGFICLVRLYYKIITLKSFTLKTVSPLGARNVYHQLFMSSLLMDLKYKKLFAIQFAKVRYLVPVAILLYYKQTCRLTDKQIFLDTFTTIFFE